MQGSMTQLPPSFPPPAKKRGLPPLAWAGIGCGGLVIVAGIAFICFAAWVGKSVAKKLSEDPGKAAAEAVIATNPDLEQISDIPDRGEMTLRLKSTGEEIRTTYTELIWGRATTAASMPLFEGDLTKIPTWVPRYPGASGESSTSHRDLPDRITGILTSTTTDSLEKVKALLDAEKAKLSISSSSESSADINGNRFLKYEYRSGKRSIAVNAFGQTGSALTVQTIYAEVK